MSSLAQRQHLLGIPAEVVVVHEDGEEPHVVAAGFGDGVLGADLEGLAVAARRAVEAHERDLFDGLRQAVLGQLEVCGRQVRERLVVVAGDRDVHEHELHAGAEDRLRVGAWRGRLRRAWAAGACAGAAASVADRTGTSATAVRPSARRPSRAGRGSSSRHHLRSLHDRHLQGALAIEIERSSTCSASGD